MPSWPSARISSGMQYAGRHSRNRDVYGDAVRLDPWFVTGLAEGEACFLRVVRRPTEAEGRARGPASVLAVTMRETVTY